MTCQNNDIGQKCIISDILGIIIYEGIQGVIVSPTLERQIYLIVQLLRNAKMLVDFRIMGSASDKRNHTFIITEKEYSFLTEYKSS